MGSKIGVPGPLFFDDILWIDPLEIMAGRLSRLVLNGGDDRLQPVGVILLAYLSLKLRLKKRGLDADFHPFDWRRDIMASGRELAERIQKEPAGAVHVVAHSMGGLVARAAMAAGAPKIRRVVQLGTPNFGSFVPVLALRGTYAVVKKIAALDLAHDPEALASTVFNTFPGLYQMLPFPGKFTDIDLYDPGQWPAAGPRPRADLLAAAGATQQALAPADGRLTLIAGVNQETVVGLSRTVDGFLCAFSMAGDGTVPLALAQIDGARTYYAEETHGSLPNNRTVAMAAADILLTGSTRLLPETWTAVRRGLTRQVPDDALVPDVFEGRRGGELRPSEVRDLIRELAAPPAAPGPSAGAPTGAAGDTEGAVFSEPIADLVIGRRRQRRLDIRLALGSITEVDAPALVLGLFRDVAPSGAARAINNRLDGAISDFSARRMLAGNAGEVFMMPTARRGLRADMILFAGLGSFDLFSDDTLQLAAENTIRAFVRTGIREFATVLFGAGSVRGSARALENLLKGILRGLVDADGERRFRGFTLCEQDPERYGRIRRELLRLSSTRLFEDFEVNLDEIELPPAPETAAAPRHRAIGPDPAYLVVRQVAGDDKHETFSTSLLTSGAKATVVTGTRTVPVADVHRHLRLIETSRFTAARLPDFGRRLAEMVLSAEVKAVLAAMEGSQLVVVHDAGASRFPWETLHVGDRFPAAVSGMSRKYLAENLSVAKWLEERRHGTQLDLLLIVNPTEDLEGAEAEGRRLEEMVRKDGRVSLTILRGSQATKPALEQAFGSGRFDVVHYAGHAFFDALRPEASGLVCSGKVVLSGRDLAAMGNLPSLVFFNACEGGRIRNRNQTDLPTIRERIRRNVSLAEAFLRGGVANYIGTYWPVGDSAAETFAHVFYSALLPSNTISQALLAARKAVLDLPSVDWADYIHFGDPGFVVKVEDR
jgi:pimeloyl-ACP methyl ester carboxylesterase